MSGCRIAWCQRGHQADQPGRAHLARTTLPGGVAVLMVQAERDGVLGEPIVRLIYPARTTGRPVPLDIEPGLSAELANVLAAIGFRDLPDLITALHTAGTTLGASA